MIVHCKLPSNVLARPETRAYVQELNKGAAPPSQKTIREIGAAIRLALESKHGEALLRRRALRLLRYPPTR